MMEHDALVNLKELEVESRRVLVRVDFDVPLRDGEVADDAKIRRVLPTIDYLVQNGARVVLLTHLGPNVGKVVPSLSLEPVARYLAAIPGYNEIYLTDSCIGDGARCVVQSLREGQICLLENLSFHAGETANDEKLARQLAGFADIYVNEAFSLCLEERASTAKINRHARLRTLGLQFARELAGLRTVLARRNRPVVFVMGGDAIEYSESLLDRFFGRIDTLIVLGKAAATFLAATGIAMGRTPVQTNRFPHARDILNRASRKNVRVVFPRDFVTQRGDTVAADALESDDVAVDFGAKTIAAVKATVSKAETILWHGTAALSDAGTGGDEAVARAIAGSAGFSAGLDPQSVAAVRALSLEKGVDFLSDGGEAATAMLLGKRLPVLAWLGQ